MSSQFVAENLVTLLFVLLSVIPFLS